MSIRRKHKVSREILAQRIGVPISIVINYECATHPEPTLYYKTRFKTIFNCTDDDLKEKKG
ncbi:XRE family transcriptional regulator [Melissococcus plutonius]